MNEVNEDTSAGPPIFHGRGTLAALAGLAIAGWVVLGIGFASARVETFFAYLTAFAFVTSIALGALVLLMTTYVVGARWNTVLRRLNEGLVAVLPVLGLCFVPLAFGLGDLYPWTAHPSSFPEHEQHLLEHKQAYLNPPFFLARTAVYFALWTLAAVLLCRWSVRRDTPGSAPETQVPHARERAFSSAVLPIVALALTFAAFDWLMSLQPFWMSSIFGVYYFAGGFVASLGLLAALAHAAARQTANVIRPPHFHALGRLMFGFTVFWAYIAFFQALLISLPNRPEEVIFYVQRLEGNWQGVAWALVLVRFVIPFFLLLPRRVKFNGRFLAVVGAGLVVGNYLDMYWLVMPVRASHGAAPSLWDVAAPCALVGTYGLAAAAWLRGKAVVPIGDPLLSQSIAYRSPM
jgi:hypothetical protein